MHGLRHLRFRPWKLAVVVIGLVAVHLIVLWLLKHAGLSRGLAAGAVVSGVVLLVLAKHLGLLGALLGPLYTLFKRRLRS